MTHLNKITIRNARRFGENVDIDFGKGATILLAPNGTGKTTVFEAIELALTGKLERVGHPPYALIRDLQTELDIRLDFDNDLFCRVNCQMGKDLELSGDRTKLFGDKIDSVPYLLRLTHLLEQRGKDWFVSAEENDAGSRLDKLSIGRELNHILGKKQSVSTALTKEQSRLEDKLTKSKEALEEFKKQLDQKSKLALNVELVPLPEILTQLKAICGLANLTIDANVEATVNSVMAFCEQTKSVINQNINDNLQKGNQFSELDSLIELYTNNIQMLETKTNENNDRGIILSQKEVSYNNNQKELDQNNIQLQAQQNSLLKLKELRNYFTEKDSILKEKAQLTTDIKELEEAQKINRPNLKVLEEGLEKTNKLFDSHNLINLEIKKNDNERIQVTKLENFQKQWVENSLKIKKIQEEVIPFIEKQKSAFEVEIATINIDLGKAATIHSEKEVVLKALKQASGEIQQAVSIIASNIADDAKDCPVCEAEYKPGDLKRRITNALNKINPLIANAVNEEKLAMEVEEGIKNKLKTNNTELKKLIDDLQAQKNQLIQFTNFLEEEIIPNFPNCKNANDAFNFIESKNKTLTTRIEELRLQKSGLEIEPTIDVINEAKLQKSELERQITAQGDKINILTERIIKTEQALKDLASKLENQSIEKIHSDIQIIGEAIEKIKSQLQTFVNSKESLEKEIKELKNNTIESAEIIAKIKSQQDGIQNKWINAKLLGNPLKNELDDAKKALSIGAGILNDAKNKLEKIDQEMSRWRSAETYQKLDKEIKDKITPHTEDTYLKNAQDIVKICDEEFINFTTKQKTLNAFFTNAKKELDTIHKHIVAVNPVWKNLLKRIVVDSRFSDGDLLNSGTYRNKSFAQIKAALHNDSIDVTKIASEAQLTDLQLTFMLTMAKKHQWTPWKALLLDDPTQHHDLVHASAVFDLLRDYIVDLDFQIMMSTHDSTQANFFHRKLQNDGIEAKIYRLNSADNGVVAERIK
ncbi:MAG: hypothetical protein A3F72_11430 [Bacteroidetes bacterium RIFCSPLOWO2_12_FULL_35_15]|nr:MAG: hypothetical protein A3F72_11430 [Bacteroidetes bacterium RIFCSPLOWO2_12_FULL_35_15]